MKVKEQGTTPGHWIEYLPLIGPLVGSFLDLFGRSEEDQLEKQIKTYGKWWANYIRYKETGKKRKNMITEQSYLMLTKPLFKRLEQIQEKYE